MNLTVRLFAGLKCENQDLDCRGKTEFSIAVSEGMTLKGFLAYIGISPELAKIVLVNALFQPMDYKLVDGDDLAIFPPVGGG